MTTVSGVHSGSLGEHFNAHGCRVLRSPLDKIRHVCTGHNVWRCLAHQCQNVEEFSSVKVKQSVNVGVFLLVVVVVGVGGGQQHFVHLEERGGGGGGGGEEKET